MRLYDQWKPLREDLYGNTEPEVELVGMTNPGGIISSRNDTYFNSDEWVSINRIENMVNETATMSTGADLTDSKTFIQHLIKMGHLTPLECIQYNFRVKGISKACGAQLSRHRIGQGHVSSSRRYMEQKAAFVYPILETVIHIDRARKTYRILEEQFEGSIITYNLLRNNAINKTDARLIMPTAIATQRMWWINARALRDFFRLRLHRTAESEIRRLAQMILDQVMQITPTLFEDIKRELDTQ